MTMEGNMCVMDYGGHAFKAGYAYNFPCDEEPRVVLPYNAPALKAAKFSVRFDAEAASPVQCGKILCFDRLEAIMRHSLYDRLGWIVGSEGSAVISEPMLTCRADRERLTQLMFEGFNVNGLFIQDQAVLSMYAVGRATGCVVDVGHGKVDVTTVVDGQACQSSVRRLPYAGQGMTAMISELMRRKGVELRGGDRSAQALKELCLQTADSQHGYETLMNKNQPGGGSMAVDAAAVGAAMAAAAGRPPAAADEAAAAASTAASGEPRTFTLPDGQQVVVEVEGQQVTEALFRPDLRAELLRDCNHSGAAAIAGLSTGHMSEMGLAEAVIDSVQTSYEGSFRRQALENMLVCGGCSSIPNLSQRLLKEVRALASPPSLCPGLCPLPEYLPQQTARNAAWIGGAVVARVVLNQSGFVTKWDYEEAGPGAIHRRCS